MVGGRYRKKAHKKGRVSKHILDAQERRKEEVAKAPKLDGETSAGAGADADPDSAPPTIKTAAPITNASKPKATTTTAAAPKKKKTKKHTKEPKDVHNYLSAWKHRESAPGLWKFNKNTQSWLFRHMYDAEKVPKATFSLLMDYMEGVQGGMRERVNEDAVRRAMRYKDWEKNGSEEAEKKTAVANADADIEDDNKRFSAMDENEKRKEYKRARKVIDELKKAQEA